MSEQIRLCTTNAPRLGWYLTGERDAEEDMILCQWCGTQYVRYVHIMGHAKHHDIEVGCVCAETISEGYVGKDTEDRLKKASKNKLNSTDIIKIIPSDMNGNELVRFLKKCGWGVNEFKKEMKRLIV